MCTALFAFGVHARLLFFLAFNRDEFLNRPTEQAHWWEDEPDVLAGRDKVKRGTWLAFSRAGRFAFLTNFREVKYDAVTDGPGRGALPISFVKGTQPPTAFLKELQDQNGFNLVAGDLSTGQIAYLTNRDPNKTGPMELPRGIYGLSNAVLDSAWPKVERGKEMLKGMLADETLCKANFSLDTVLDTIMCQCDKVHDHEALPTTGLGVDLEEKLSSIMIQPTTVAGNMYGTRMQTGVAVWNDGSLEFKERTIQAAHPQSEPRTVNFEFEVPISQFKDIGGTGESSGTPK